MDPAGPKVLSRYLRGSKASCHDHCKCEIKQTTETKPIIPFPKRVPKPPADRTHIDASNSLPRLKKLPSVIPKVTTRIVKDQILKKDVANEPKKREAKTYNLQSSRTPRRSSDIFLLNEDTPLQLSRFSKRRLSEVIIHPNKDVASVSKVSMVRGSRINKNESRKDSKLPLVNKRPNSLKTIVSTPKLHAKVAPLRSYKSLPKPEIKGSRKSKAVKPIEEDVPEMTLHVIEPNNGVEITKSQSQISPASSSSSKEKVNPKDSQHNDQNELQVSSPSMEDDDPTKVGQHNDQNALSKEDDDPTNDGQQSDQNALSMEDDNPATDGQHNDHNALSMEDDDPTKDGQHNNDQSELQVSSPSMEDDSHATDGQHNDQNVLSMEDDDPTKDGQDNDQNALQVSLPTTEYDSPTKDGQQNDQNALQASPPSMEDDSPATDGLHNNQNALEASSPSMEDDNPATDGFENDNVSDSEVNDTNETTRVQKLAVETEDGSPDELRFRRGTVISPQSENSSLRKLEFKKGKELDEDETEKCENTSLRRLSSDGVVCIPESQTISVDLKHQEMEEKKDHSGLSNKVIEETASKLIRTRKSKVQALVGAFENIVL